MIPLITQSLLNEKGNLLHRIYILVTLGIKHCFPLTNMRAGVGCLNLILARSGKGRLYRSRFNLIYQHIVFADETCFIGDCDYHDFTKKC